MMWQVIFIRGKQRMATEPSECPERPPTYTQEHSKAMGVAWDDLDRARAKLQGVWVEKYGNMDGVKVYIGYPKDEEASEEDDE